MWHVDGAGEHAEGVSQIDSNLDELAITDDGVAARRSCFNLFHEASSTSLATKR